MSRDFAIFRSGWLLALYRSPVKEWQVSWLVLGTITLNGTDITVKRLDRNVKTCSADSSAIFANNGVCDIQNYCQQNKPADLPLFYWRPVHDFNFKWYRWSRHDTVVVFRCEMITHWSVWCPIDSVTHMLVEPDAQWPLSLPDIHTHKHSLSFLSQSLQLISYTTFFWVQSPTNAVRHAPHRWPPGQRGGVAYETRIIRCHKIRCYSF